MQIGQRANKRSNRESWSEGERNEDRRLIQW